MPVSCLMLTMPPGQTCLAVFIWLGVVSFKQQQLLVTRCTAKDRISLLTQPSQLQCFWNRLLLPVF